MAILLDQANADDDNKGHEEEHEHKHKTIEVGVPYKIHTVRTHHHIQKYPVYKKIEIPVIKKIRVPFYVKFPVKVPYPVIIKPHIVQIPIHKYPVHSSEHKHHEHNKGHGNEHHEVKHEQSHDDHHQFLDSGSAEMDSYNSYVETIDQEHH